MYENVATETMVCTTTTTLLFVYDHDKIADNQNVIKTWKKIKNKKDLASYGFEPGTTEVGAVCQNHKLDKAFRQQKQFNKWVNIFLLIE